VINAGTKLGSTRSLGRLVRVGWVKFIAREIPSSGATWSVWRDFSARRKFWLRELIRADAVYCGIELAGGVEEMTIAAGTELGAYEIVAPIGADGMGDSPSLAAAADLIRMLIS
jgi:hypothetical protein